MDEIFLKIYVILTGILTVGIIVIVNIALYKFLIASFPVWVGIIGVIIFSGFMITDFVYTIFISKE